MIKHSFPWIMFKVKIKMIILNAGTLKLLCWMNEVPINIYLINEQMKGMVIITKNEYVVITLVVTC